MTKEQEAILKSVREFCAKEIIPVATELDLISDPDETFPRVLEIIKKGRDLELSYMLIPEDYGGMGLDNITIGIIFEELAAADAGFAGNLGISNIAWLPLMIGGTDEQKEKWFKIATESDEDMFLASWAVTEPQGIGLNTDDVWETGQFTLNVKTTATKEGNYYRIDGEKCFITGGAAANLCVVLAETSEGPSHFIVPTDTPGFNVIRNENLMGHRTMINSALSFDGVKVPEENLISMDEGNGVSELLGVAGYSDAWVAAIAVGLSRAAYECASTYAKERIIGGKPIIQYQATGMMISDMSMLIEAARAMTWKALWINDTREEPDGKLSALSKVFASDAAMKITTDAVQVYGGAGYMKENPVEKYMRDAKVMQIYEGPNHLLRVLVSIMDYLGM
ncbi:MAG: acyl-CoA dehydrogenase [Desulfobacteraceae bacterium]|nr:acyl-CoA dehydrogenase family protein [Desulfobacteraceae bacterium]MBC2756535.1 acyl-CoA dehydrogenase [Desulfobacteraceae bacterium]